MEKIKLLKLQKEKNMWAKFVVKFTSTGIYGMRFMDFMFIKMFEYSGFSLINKYLRMWNENCFILIKALILFKRSELHL